MEDAWDQAAEKEFGEIDLNGHAYDSFDVAGINRQLEPLGFLYGAGFSRGLKPVFFLARIEQKRKIDGRTVYVLGSELARDLLTMPAFTNNGIIVVRRDSARVYLWDQIAYLGKSGRPALRFALEQYGLGHGHYKDLPGFMDTILEDEVNVYIRHELGEIHETRFPVDIWRELIAAFPHSPIELLARALKDLLADTNDSGTLNYIIKERKAASLGFYTAFLDGLRRELFPEMRESFDAFLEAKDWAPIEEARQKAHRDAIHRVDTILSAFENAKTQGDMNQAGEEIGKRLLEPLGL
jgi:hypothetical protein